MTNKDKSTEKIRELIGTKKVYRVYYTISEELLENNHHVH